MKFAVVLISFFVIAVGAISFLVRVPKTEFDAEVWKSFHGECSHEKYGMTDDLLESGKLIGLDSNQVKDLLGSESIHQSPNKIEFCAGHDSKFTFNRPYHIVLQFKLSESGESKVASAFLEGPP